MATARATAITAEATAATGNGQNFDPRELSLSEVPLDLLPAFGPIEQAIVLYCKVITGKATMEELEKKYGHSKVKTS